MIVFDPSTNFGYGVVSTPPSPTSSGTTLILGSGQGVNFPDPSTSGAYNVVVFPTDEQPTSSNAEIVRVTAKSSDTLTITRTQESTSARSIVAGDNVALVLSKKRLDDVSTALKDGFVFDTLLPSESFTRASSTQFTVPTDKTTYYTKDRVLRFSDGSLGYVTSSSYGTGVTTVNVSGTIPNPLTSVEFAVSPKGVFPLLKESGSDATGDIYYRNASGTLTRLAIGTAGQYLSVSGSVPAWASVSVGSFVPVFGYAVSTADQNHASNDSYVDITGMSASLSLGSDNYTVVAFANQGCGVSNVDTQGMLRIVIDSDNGNPSLVKPGVTSGAHVGMPIHKKTGRTGTITVKVQASRQSGSGNFTTYNAHGTLMVMAFHE